MSFADILKSQLKLKGMTQGGLAKATGLTEGSISRYISQERIPSTTNLNKIAKALRVSTDYLLGITGAEQYADASLKGTVPLMISPDYKDRFLAKYIQTKIRYEKLKATCNKWDAAKLSGEDVDKFLGFIPKCSIDLLREQQRHMGNYLHTLEVRAVIEGIDLN